MVTGLVRVVSLLTPLISSSGVYRVAACATTPCIRTLTPYAFARSYAYASARIKSKERRTALKKWKLLSRTSVCEGSTTVENCLPLASCLSDKRTSPIISHRRLREFYPLLRRKSLQVLFKILKVPLVLGFIRQDFLNGFMKCQSSCFFGRKDRL